MTTRWEDCPHCKLIFVDARIDYDKPFWHPPFRGPDKEKQYHEWHLAKEGQEESDNLERRAS
jgi:hypothetical protein